MNFAVCPQILHSLFFLRVLSPAVLSQAAETTREHLELETFLQLPGTESLWSRGRFPEWGPGGPDVFQVISNCSSSSAAAGKAFLELPADVQPISRSRKPACDPTQSWRLQQNKKKKESGSDWLKNAVVWGKLAAASPHRSSSAKQTRERGRKMLL